jgi:hypothetical protein
VLIDDMVDTYEVEAQRFLDAEAKNVELLVAAVRRCLAEKRSPELLQRLLSRIKEVVTNWDMVAQPIQLSAMGRGLDHALSHRVAGQVRDLGVELFNEHGLLEQSKFLTALLQDSFQEVPRVADATQQDADALGEIARKQDAAKREFERAITYSARLGPTRSEVFRISPEGIEWQGVRWPLEAITRIRWGGIASQLSGHPQFLVSFGNAERSSDVIVFEPEVFTAITDRLWRAVGPRLTVEMLTRLRRGAELRFGQVTVTDTEVQVGRSRGPWSNVGLGSRNGHLEITLQQPYNRGSLPFLEVDNAHVLAFVLGNALEQKLDRLSKLLRD